MQFQIENRGRAPEVQPEFVQVGDDTIIGSTTWSTDDGGRTERYQVLTIRDGKIADMEGFASRRQAERYARRRGRAH